MGTIRWKDRWAHWRFSREDQRMEEEGEDDWIADWWKWQEDWWTHQWGR